MNENMLKKTTNIDLRRSLQHGFEFYLKDYSRGSALSDRLIQCRLINQVLQWENAKDGKLCK